MAKLKQARLPTLHEAADGSRLSLANAEQHFTCAEHLATSAFWGIASSHLVLALEEGQKAYILSLLAAGVPSEDLNLRLVLSHHGTRHSLAFWDIFALVNFEIMSRQKAQTDTRFGLEPEEKPPDEARKAWFDGVQREVQDLTKATPDTNDDLAAFDWIRSANQLKNQGFYVDFRHGTWHTPVSISAELYQRGKKVSRRFLDLRIGAIDFFLSADHQAVKALVDEIEVVKRKIAADPRLASVAGLLTMISEEL